MELGLERGGPRGEVRGKPVFAPHPPERAGPELPKWQEGGRRREHPEMFRKQNYREYSDSKIGNLNTQRGQYFLHGDFHYSC